LEESVLALDGRQRKLRTIFIPTLYFIEGLPYTMVNMMSVVLLKNLNFDNSAIGLYTSLLYIPWTIKFLWAPIVDLFLSRRRWILISHVMLAIVTLVLGMSIFQGVGLRAYCSLFCIIAVISATQDIATDGYYMDVLNRDEQALFVGIRNAAYKIAWLFGQGGLVYLAGKLIEQAQGQANPANYAWSISFAICAVIFVIAAFWHKFVLPERKDFASTSPEAGDRLQIGPAIKLLAQKLPDILMSFLRQPGIVVVIAYILTFRIGDAFLLKMAQPFWLDPYAKGGLNISTAQVGLIYGTVGLFSLLAGGICGGWLVSKYSLKRCLLPTALVQNGAILLYWLLAVFKPGIVAVALTNALEQFAYGLGTAAYTVFLLTTVKEEYKAAHYAIATALMALGLVVPGALSGYLADQLGYQNFFLLSFFLSFPGIICILFLPIMRRST
jgi:PAT family beta-lactamase induction signal transducer AmpG